MGVKVFLDGFGSIRLVWFLLLWECVLGVVEIQLGLLVGVQIFGQCFARGAARMTVVLPVRADNKALCLEEFKVFFWIFIARAVMGHVSILKCDVFEI